MFHQSASEVSSLDPSELWSCNNCGNRPRTIIHIGRTDKTSLDFCDCECMLEYLNSFSDVIPFEIRESLEDYINENC